MSIQLFDTMFDTQPYKDTYTRTRKHLPSVTVDSPLPFLSFPVIVIDACFVCKDIFPVPTTKHMFCSCTVFVCMNNDRGGLNA